MNTTPVAWIVDDDASVRWVLEKALSSDGMATRSFPNASDLLQAFDRERPNVLITDIRMPDIDGLEMMRRIDATSQSLPVIVMTAHADLDSAVAAYQGGAFEYLPKPFDVDEAVELVRRAIEASKLKVEQPTDSPLPPIKSMIGRAPAMQEVFRTIGRLARSSMNVLITGESGTGKELVAHALHEHSPRAAEPFVALNTTAIAAELLESELFGHERGAFTGADSSRAGRFEQADQGTLFLDEIGDMSADLQTRLLRVLAEGDFYRVGGQQPVHVDVRIISATNQDLTEAVRNGKFREDLYHRLNVIHIQTPPLRRRREDIPLLLEHYLSATRAQLGVEPKQLTAAAAALLRAYDWPGNVRELVNVCRRLTVTAPGTEIRAEDIPEQLGGQKGMPTQGLDWAASLRRWARRYLDEGTQGPLLDEALPEFERALIEVALVRAQGRRQDAARLLGWGRNTLTRKIRELNIDD